MALIKTEEIGLLHATILKIIIVLYKKKGVELCIAPEYQDDEIA